MYRQVLEGDRPIPWHTPQGMGALVEGDLVGVDVPRPQGHPGRVSGDTQALGVPHQGA